MSFTDLSSQTFKLGSLSNFKKGGIECRHKHIILGRGLFFSCINYSNQTSI
jgi:hypothetical protein